MPRPFVLDGAKRVIAFPIPADAPVTVATGRVCCASLPDIPCSLSVEINSFLDPVREQAETIKRTVLDGAAG
jgi:hypothetical protein